MDNNFLSSWQKDTQPCAVEVPSLPHRFTSRTHTARALCILSWRFRRDRCCRDASRFPHRLDRWTRMSSPVAGPRGGTNGTNQALPRTGEISSFMVRSLHLSQAKCDAFDQGLRVEPIV